jgi:hypothetical protein
MMTRTYEENRDREKSDLGFIARDCGPFYCSRSTQFRKQPAFAGHSAAELRAELSAGEVKRGSLAQQLNCELERSDPAVSTVVSRGPESRH